MHPVPEDFMIWPSKPLSTCVTSHRAKRFTELKDYSRLVSIWVTPCWMRDFNCAQLHTWQMLNIKQSLPYRDFEEQMTLIWESKWHFCGVQPGSPSFLLIHHPATAPCSEGAPCPAHGWLHAGQKQPEWSQFSKLTSRWKPRRHTVSTLGAQRPKTHWVTASDPRLIPLPAAAPSHRLVYGLFRIPQPATAGFKANLL